MKFLERAAYEWSEDSIRLISTPSQLAKASFFYVQEVGYFKTNPNYFTERAHLNSYLIVYTLTGKGCLTYKDKKYILTAGQVFFIDCMEYHYYETCTEECWEFLWIHFNGATSHGYYEAFAQTSPPILEMSKDSNTPNYIRQILENQGRIDIPTEILNSNLILNLLTELLLVSRTQFNMSASFPMYIQNIIKYFDSCFNEDICLDMLSEKFSVSKFHLSKEFKRCTGLSPNEYLISTRVNYAKELLQHTELTISGISEMVGIPNISHFIKLFKNRVEMTPLAFRNKWKL